MLYPQHLELCPVPQAPSKYAWDKISVEELSVRCNGHPSPTASGPDLQAHNLGTPAEPQGTSHADSYVSPCLLTPIWLDQSSLLITGWAPAGTPEILPPGAMQIL